MKHSPNVAVYDDVTTVRWSSESPDDLFVVENPATGEVITTVEGGGVEAVDGAVQAARRAFLKSWRQTTPRERSGYSLRCANVLEDHADELSELESRENGKPILDARPHDVVKHSGYGREHTLGLFRTSGNRR